MIRPCSWTRMIHVALLNFTAPSVKSVAIMSEKWEEKRAKEVEMDREVGVKMREGERQITLCLHLSEFNWALQEKKNSKIIYLPKRNIAQCFDVPHASRTEVSILKRPAVSFPAMVLHVGIVTSRMCTVWPFNHVVTKRSRSCMRSKRFSQTGISCFWDSWFSSRKAVIIWIFVLKKGTGGTQKFIKLPREDAAEPLQQPRTFTKSLSQQMQ